MSLLLSAQIQMTNPGSIDLFYSLFKLFLLSMVLLCGISLLYITTKPASEQQKWIQLTLMGFFMTVMSYFLEVSSSNLDTMFVVIKIGHITKALSTLCFLKYTSNYCRVNIPRKIMNAYYIYEAWIVINIIFSDTNQFFYHSYEIKYFHTMPYFSAKYGFVFFIYSYGLCAAIFIVLFMITRRLVKVNIEERKRLRFLFVTALTPVLGYLIGSFAYYPFIDFVPISFGISAMLLFIASKRHGLLDVVLSAKNNIVENTKEGIIVIDNEYNVLYANTTAIELFENVYDYKTGEELENFKKFFDGKKNVLDLKDRNYNVSVSDIYENKKLRGKVAWLFDVTESQKYTEEILRLKDAAEQANQSKSAFLANMSHEIRTPMNAIIGFSELVIEQEQRQDLKNYMYDIHNSAKNLLHIINQILDISKIESGKTELKKEEYSIHQILQDVMVITSNQAEQKGLRCDMIVNQKLPSKLYGAPGEMREILINVLNNSVKYTKEGLISLHVTFIKTAEDSGNLSFIISDTGVGMKEEDVKRIYDRFRKFDSMKNQGIEGSGLGMYIVKSIITRMDGTIDIDSEYGKGTKITILIPQKIVDESPVSEFEIKQREESKTGQAFYTTARILAVDDNEVNLKLVASLLAKYKVYPALAKDGETAIQMLQDKTFDLILMDHMMPGMDGVETMQEIRKMRDGMFQSLPIVVFTANAIAGVKEKMISLGFQDYISKPIDIEQMEQMLLKYLPKDKVTFLKNETVEEIEIPEENKEDLNWINKYQSLCKHVKIEEGYRNCGGQLQDYIGILNFVEKQGDDRIKEIQELLEEKDYKNYTINVHSLKSTAYNIGAMELGDAAKNLEAAGKEENQQFISKHAEDMLVEFRIVLLEIKKCLHIMKLEENPDTVKQEQDMEMQENQDEAELLSKDDLKEVLGNIKKMLDEFEMDEAQEILKEVLSVVQFKEDKEHIQEMIAALEKFDLEKAQELLSKE